MGSVSPTEGEIMQALEASGFLMEQEVASILEDLGFHVQTGRAFQDPDEGKSRELDVWAFRKMSLSDDVDPQVGLYLLIACKNNSNPVVFLSRKKVTFDRDRDPIEYVFPVRRVEVWLDRQRSSLVEMHPFHTLGLADQHYYWRSTMKAVQFVQLTRRTTWEATHGGLFDSVFYPLAKAVMGFTSEWRDQRNFKPKAVSLFTQLWS
jgi:hypothetical protein